MMVLSTLCFCARSDREVHTQHQVLPDLQLCEQDHPSPAVQMHALPLPAPGRQLCHNPAAIRHRQGGVRRTDAITVGCLPLILQSGAETMPLDIPAEYSWERVDWMHW